MRRNPYGVEQIIGIVMQHENGRATKAPEEESRKLEHVIAEITLDKRTFQATLRKQW